MRIVEYYRLQTGETRIVCFLTAVMGLPYRLKEAYFRSIMNITLTPSTEAYIRETVRTGAFASASEFVEAVARRQMFEEESFEEKVLEGLKGSVTRLTREDLAGVRKIARDGRGR